MTSFDFAPSATAVLFDAGNTLLTLDHARIAEILRAAGAACTEAEVRTAEMQARPRLDPFVRSAVRRESAETVSRYCDLILDGLPPGARAAKAAIASQWSALWTPPVADARAAIDGLIARGVTVGVVSNSNGQVRHLLERAGLLAGLACVVDSSLVGIEKPDPRIFAIGAEAICVPPARCVYVGDFLSLDARGARAAGMHGVLLDPIGAWGDAADVPRVASLTELMHRSARRPGS